jgi:hypothetical protein
VQVAAVEVAITDRVAPEDPVAVDLLVAALALERLLQEQSILAAAVLAVDITVAVLLAPQVVLALLF